MVAVLAGVLMPGAFHAMSQFSGGGHWAEICTPSGMKVIAVDAGQQAPAETDPGILVGSCSFCATHANAWVLPADHKGDPAQARVGSLPSHQFHTPRLRPVWVGLQARAPPLRS